jgi:DNA-binding transcriptional ArsR family regulator
VLSNFSEEVQRMQVVRQRTPVQAAPPAAEGVRTLRQPNHELRPSEISELVEAYEARSSIAALATRFELHYEIVRAHLMRSGVVLRGNAKPASPSQRRTILRLHRQGITNKEIARRIGMSARTVGRALRGGDSAIAGRPSRRCP